MQKIGIANRKKLKRKSLENGQRREEISNSYKGKKDEKGKRREIEIEREEMKVKGGRYIY